MLQIKKLIVLTICALSSLSVSAETRLTEEQRNKALQTTPSRLTDVWSNPYIQACWKESNLGSDSALSALVLIAHSRGVIDEMSKKRTKAIKSAKNSKEAYESLKAINSKENYLKVKEAVTMLPKSQKYCETLYNLKYKEIEE